MFDLYIHFVNLYSLLADNPDYEESVEDMPKKMFSGKAATTRNGYFFCYELPTKRSDGSWSDGDGLYRWYFVDPASGEVAADTYEIWKAIQCQHDELRKFDTTEEQFAKVRKTVDSYIRKTYLKAVQAPLGVKPRMVTWMQMS